MGYLCLQAFQQQFMKTMLRVLNKYKKGYIKGDRTKHISLKFFFMHKLQKSHEIEVKQIRSSDNVVDLFTKSFPSSTFKKLTYDIGMRRVCDQSS